MRGENGVDECRLAQPGLAYLGGETRGALATVHLIRVIGGEMADRRR